MRLAFAARIRTRALWLALFPATLACLLLSGLFVWTHWSEAFEELDTRGRSLVRQLASASEYGIYSGNVEALRSIAVSLLGEEGVEAVVMFGTGGELLISEHLHPAPGTVAFWPLRDRPVSELGDTLVFARPVRLTPGRDELTPGGGADLARLPSGGYVLIQLTKQGAYADQRRLIGVGVGIVLTVLGIALGLALMISRGLTQPLQRVVQTVARFGEGRLDVRLPVEGGRDFEMLAQNLNAMAERLAHARADMQREIESATRELRERKDEAERANVAKTRFLAAASHDLRQPMHALGLFAAQLRTEHLGGEAARLAQRVGESVEIMSGLLDSLLDISRLDAGGTEPRRAPLSVASLFSRLALTFSPEAEAKGLRLRVRPALAWVLSDAALLEQLLRNLMANALRYTSRGTILLAARVRGDRLRIEVRDSGPGIPEDMQSLIFQEFVQLGNPERDRDKGLGLGLAIVERLGRLLDHPLGVRSRPGAGAVFWVDVPLTTGQVIAAETAPSRPVALVSALVLLVDDDAAVRSGTAGLLESWGCTVVAAANAAAALAQSDALGRRPDLVICDHHRVDGDNGFAIIEDVRRRFGATLPALLLSGETDSRLSEVAGARGLPLLFKPVRPARLRAALNALLPASDD